MATDDDSQKLRQQAIDQLMDGMGTSNKRTSTISKMIRGIKVWFLIIAVIFFIVPFLTGIISSGSVNVGSPGGVFGILFGLILPFVIGGFFIMKLNAGAKEGGTK